MQKNAWKSVLITPESIIFSAIEKINQTALQIALVVDQYQRLQGVITDGDVRRHLLRQGKLDEPVSIIMNKNPVVGLVNESREQWLQKMQNLSILHLPIVNFENKIVDLETLTHLTVREKKENWVIFMAGGLGTRLHPITLDFPKPLVKIGNKPILEILLENFVQSGFQHFYFSVHYKAKMIEDYFGCGKNWGVDISYLHEDHALGTIGSLKLLPEKPNLPFLVMNADIMTNMNFSKILDFHEKNTQHPLATVCVRQYENKIPYGVVNIDDRYHHFLEIEEKPTRSYFVNAGIYVLEPDVLNYFPARAHHLDMPTLLTYLVQQKKCVSTFPIREYWLDIGSHENLIQAADDYQKVFIDV